MKKSFPVLALTVLTLLTLAGCAASPAEPAAEKVCVMLAVPEGLTVEGENPIFVTPGKSAVFKVSVADGWCCLNGGAGDYSSRASSITLRNVRYPTTLSPDVIPENEKVKFFCELAQNRGVVSSDIRQGFVRAGTEVTVTAEPHDGWYFSGWSLSRGIAEGGELLSRDAVFTYTVEKNSFVYANFAKKKDASAQAAWNPAMGKQLITYNAMGGIYAETGKEVVTFDQKKYHIYENTLPDMDYFLRDGYQLIEYNTRPDGTGEAFSPGSKLTLDGAVMLYCIWAKESDPADFQTESVSGGVAIKGYTGKDTTLVIPEKIGGKAVVRIRTGAIRCPDAETLVIPKSVKYLEAGAFETTAALTTLYVHDAIVSANDKAITDMSGLANVRLSAARAPAFTNKPEGNFGRKWERLVSLKQQGKKVLVVLAGSSTFYGLDSPMLEELLGGEYAVVNFGTSASTAILFFLEGVSHYMEEGDILVFAPEMDERTIGASALPWAQFRATEYAYNEWREIDLRRYSGFFSAMTSFNKYRKTTELDYTHVSDMMNDYGDRVNVTTFNPDNYDAGFDVRFEAGRFVGERLENLLEVIDMYKERGAAFYMSWAPCNANAINDNYRSFDVQSDFCAEVERRLGVPVISHPSDYIYPGKYMYNSDHHVNIHGRTLRTEALAKDILAQWAKEGR